MTAEFTTGQIDQEGENSHWDSTKAFALLLRDFTLKAGRYSLIKNF
ncbi:unnamed protein product [marine sediment metagenome]|uniref:Uncharacterized protein n=1 Tax=marine sediment metagenome TaxID=412755 RepID=X0XZ72_9ZZZZ